MKTILIAHNYTQNSFPVMSFHLANHLANKGNRVIFISHNPYFHERQVIKKENAEIIVCSWPSQSRPTKIKDFVWFINIYLKYKPDTIIAHFVGSNITAIVSKILSFGKASTLVYYHTLSSQILTDLKKLNFKQKFLFYRKKTFYRFFCDKLICPSELAKKDLKDYYSNTNGVVVLNPIIDRFTGKMDISNSNIVISFLGRIDLSKGVLDLVTAFKIYIEKFPNSRLILNIAGSGSLQFELTEMIRNTPTIYYLGGLIYEKIDEYLNKSHFVIIPSKFDAFNVVGIESMMNQTPLLISNTTGLTEYLTDGKECFKFDSDIESIVAVLKKAEDDFIHYKQMSVNARDTFLIKFSINDYCNKFSELIS